MPASATRTRTRHRRQRRTSHARELERTAARVEESPAFQALARAGIGARVVIYVVLAILTSQIAALGRSSAAADAQGAFFTIGRQPGGGGFLVVLAVALALYASWRALQTITGLGGARTRWARVGTGAGGVLYALLCAEVARQLFQGTGSSGGGERPESLAATVLHWPAGPVLLGAAGVAVGASGIALAAFGLLRDYGKVLERRRTPVGVVGAARVLGGLGDLGRGGALVGISIALTAAAVEERAASARSLGQELEALSRHLWGTALVAAVALSFAAFAAYSFLELAYRDV